jgi:hypothetical protein
MQVTMVQYWSLQESVVSMGVASANPEEASGAPVIKAILGNTAMKVGYLFNCISNQCCP